MALPKRKKKSGASPSLSTYFAFECTLCGNDSEQTSPPTQIYAMDFDDDGSLISDQHSACAPCVRLIEEHNLPIQAKLDEISRTEPPWSPTGDGQVLKAAGADKKPRKEKHAEVMTKVPAVEAPKADPAMAMIAAALASLAEGQNKLLAALAPTKVEDEPPAAPVARRGKKR